MMNHVRVQCSFKTQRKTITVDFLNARLLAGRVTSLETPRLVKGRLPFKHLMTQITLED